MHECEEAEDRLTDDEAGGEHDPVDPGSRALEHGHGRPERERTRRGDRARTGPRGRRSRPCSGVNRPAQIASARSDVSGSTPASAACRPHRQRDQRQRRAVARRRREHRRVGDQHVVDVPQPLPRIAHRRARVVTHPCGAHPVAGDGVQVRRHRSRRSRRREPGGGVRARLGEDGFEARAPVVRARDLDRCDV